VVVVMVSLQGGAGEVAGARGGLEGGGRRRG